MAVYVVGDVHADTYFEKMTDPELMGLTKDDYVIVCGDFEIVRADPEERAFCIARYEEMPYSVLFVDGNHEEHALIAAYPQEEWAGGVVRRISDHVRYLERGFVFEVGGVSLLALGGAKTFAGLREAGLLDGPDPGVPTKAQRARAEANLAAHEWKVDLVVSHAAPSVLVKKLPERSNTPTSDFTDWLEAVAGRTDFGMWLFGHYHCDAEPAQRFRCLLNQIYRVSDGSVLREPVVDPQKGRRKGALSLPGKCVFGATA